MTLELIEKMSKDIRAASTLLTDDEARYLVDTYYAMQANRIRADNQIRAMSETGEPGQVIAWLSQQSAMMEQQIKGALERYAKSKPVGAWAMSQKGIGPVIAAGLLAHIDIRRAETAGAIWSFAGLANKEWKKGEKRPHNAQLKTLCWKMGESFVKVSGKEDAFYGQLYAERKALENQRNDAGEFAAQAAAKLEKYKIGKSTDAYKAYSTGRLPPAHIHARAKRYAVKMFLSHLHEVWRTAEGLPVPNPFPISHLGHVHKIEVPMN